MSFYVTHCVTFSENLNGNINVWKSGKNYFKLMTWRRHGTSFDKSVYFVRRTTISGVTRFLFLGRKLWRIRFMLVHIEVRGYPRYFTQINHSNQVKLSSVKSTIWRQWVKVTTSPSTTTGLVLGAGNNDITCGQNVDWRWGRKETDSQ